MKRNLRSLTICVSFLCLVITSCVLVRESPATPTGESYPIPSATVALLTPPLYTLTSTLTPASNFGSTPYQIVFPSVTISPQDAKNALLELLKTNGNCTGKCIAGIQPDTMTLQEAVDKMAKWGMVEIYENPRNGKTFINLVRNPLNGQVYVDLSVGTWTKKMITIDNLFFHIAGPPGDSLLREDVWLANREAWQGFRLDNILKAYGIPSYIGYFFQTTVDIGAPLEGRTISYQMEIQYERINLMVGIGAVAYYDGKNLFLCPSKDPHGLVMEINPERPLKELQEFSPVTWRALTGMDLDAFYKTFTGENAFDACVTTNLEQIQALQPSFR